MPDSSSCAPPSSTLVTANLIPSLACLTGLSDLNPKLHSSFPSSTLAFPLCSSPISAHGCGAKEKTGVRDNSQLEQVGGCSISPSEHPIDSTSKHARIYPPLCMLTASTPAYTFVLYLDFHTSLLINLPVFTFTPYNSLSIQQAKGSF